MIQLVQPIVVVVMQMVYVRVKQDIVEINVIHVLQDIIAMVVHVQVGNISMFLSYTQDFLQMPESFYYDNLKGQVCNL